jgi:hypothetical protein
VASEAVRSRLDSVALSRFPARPKVSARIDFDNLTAVLVQLLEGEVLPETKRGAVMPEQRIQL